ncbi:putative bifunctional diguanylate cyclase/phosphodiesterase [Pseudomonas fragariae (ex Marin et al. 2024)]|uniref:putative bifunctional diguanylate cyclase/phosphodiesterase n=1 Tax=Pseudomonas fragariae (ex Marin et al. 2024) TaxID=3080056 RepID=UPI003F7A5094
MTYLRLPSPYRLIQLLFLILLTVMGLSILWEFELEAWVMRGLGLPYDGIFEDGERLRFVLTSTGFSLIAMIGPGVMLIKMISNARRNYLQLEGLQSHTEKLARYDLLSGLLNRRAFIELVNEQLAQLEPVIVMLIDLDYFKAVNDQRGHATGDAVLIEVAKRLEEIAIKYGGIASRLGGDEFCVVFTSRREERELGLIAADVISRIGAPMLEKLRPFRQGATVGISRSWVDATETSALLHCADVAMYRGKVMGRSTYHFYETEHGLQYQAQIDEDAALKQAVELQEIVPFYQPIVALPSQEVVGFEILARWLKPDGSTGMPADFIPALERLGLIPMMTQSLVKQACSAARNWEDHLHLSLNVSAAMITDELFPDRFLDQLRHEQFPFDRFEVEITEEALVGNIEAAERNLNRLHAHGITVALDDFGTGYSGLYHLTRLSIDKIKIDRSFFELGKTDHRPMVEAILGMARSLNMKVTAEGIEDFHSPSLPSWLASNGCNYAQGYHYGRPQAQVSRSVAGVTGPEVLSRL